MTSSLHRKPCRRAFTLIEMLVVIGILVLLVAFAVPALSRARRASVRTAMAADLAIISGGLEAYKADFGDYPRKTTVSVNGESFNGAALLCWALVAPGPSAADGADGPGFRTRGITGTIKGPYLPVDRFTIGQYDSQAFTSGSPSVHASLVQSAADDVIDVLADRYYRPILYFPANKGADPFSKSVPDGAYLNRNYSALALFNYGDNAPIGPTPNTDFALFTSPNNVLFPKVMCYRLGAHGNAGAIPDGNLGAGDSPVTMGPYLLWSPGPDTYFGTNDDVANSGNELQLDTSTPPPILFQDP